MDKLTQEEAERAARDCGYKKEYKLPAGGPGALSVGIGINTYVKKTRWRRDKEIITDISLDPYFWFSRLWDKLCELSPTNEYPDWGDLMTYTKFAVYQFDDRTDIYLGYDPEKRVSNSHPCLALCEAIEVLRGSK